MFKIEQFRARVLLQSVRVEKKELTPKQLSSVPCPTCGAAAGERCELHSGAPRSEPHVDRKFAAIEAADKNRIHTVHAISRRIGG
jgi:hypothetical protein